MVLLAIQTHPEWGFIVELIFINLIKNDLRFGII